MSSSSSPSNGVAWAVPEELKVPPDEMVARLEIYRESILLHLREREAWTTRLVSALDIARVLTSQLHIGSGVLPEGAIWWGSVQGRETVAIWRPPRVWRAALQLEPFKPPRRFKLPMPGLIFVSSPGLPPYVFAAKRRPKTMKEMVYQAPLFNVFESGRSCQGSHQYPPEPEKHPESFFQAFFTQSSMGTRSKKYGGNLLRLWEELDGQHEYPVEDLVEVEPLQKALERLWR